MMLGLLKFLPMVGSSLSAVALAGAAFWAWNTYIDNPSIVREQKAVCVATVELAAERARAEERERQSEINRMLTRAFNDRLAQLQIEQQARDDALEQGNDDYVANLSPEARACTGLTESMRSFVLGN